MSPFTLSLHLFFDRPLFLRCAVDCHYKTRQTAARQTDTRQTGKTRQTVARQTGKTRQTVARQTGIASKWDAPNWTASNRHASKRTRQTGLTAMQSVSPAPTVMRPLIISYYIAHCTTTSEPDYCQRNQQYTTLFTDPLHNCKRRARYNKWAIKT